MFSKADSFPIKSIRTSGNKVMGNLSKNTQTYILGKKVGEGKLFMALIYI